MSSRHEPDRCFVERHVVYGDAMEDQSLIVRVLTGPQMELENRRSGDSVRLDLLAASDFREAVDDAYTVMIERTAPTPPS